MIVNGIRNHNQRRRGGLMFPLIDAKHEILPPYSSDARLLEGVRMTNLARLCPTKQLPPTRRVGGLRVAFRFCSDSDFGFPIFCPTVFLLFASSFFRFFASFLISYFQLHI